MKRSDSIVAIVVVALLLGTLTFFLAARPTPTPRVEPRVPASAEGILRLVNEERAKVGVRPLVVHTNLAGTAQWKATDMSLKNYRAHHMPGSDRLMTPEISNIAYSVCSIVSENLYWRDAPDTTDRDALVGWMGSEPHRNAILDPRYTDTGIGIAGDDKKVVVQHFCIAK